MDKFLPHTDTLGRLINEQSAVLYRSLASLDASRLGLPDHCLYYYNASHSGRLFFSIETSAHLLYRAIRMKGRVLGELTVMDYGAGVGTLYLLAKLIGCRKVIYNDHLDDWRLSAQLIAEAIGITIDEYIVGDVDECLRRLKEEQVQCDIITSRNVIEHIYRLDRFYAALQREQPGALVFSSTTANAGNPAAVWKHRRWHKKWEKEYRKKRADIISRQLPALSATLKEKLAAATQGLALDDLSQAIEDYRQYGKFPDPSPHGTNTCDPETGVWAEHLLRFDEYRKQINEAVYQVEFAPGFWDTHYSKPYMNAFGRMMNRRIARGDNTAIRMAPFIYVIASPK